MILVGALFHSVSISAALGWLTESLLASFADERSLPGQFFSDRSPLSKREKDSQPSFSPSLQHLPALQFFQVVPSTHTAIMSDEVYEGAIGIDLGA